MKRILIALAVIASMQIADAQVKSIADAKKMVTTAENASQNPKKAAKAATWLKLGQAYVAAYDAPAGNIWPNATKQELALVMGAEKPSSTSVVEVSGESFTKEVYADKNLYFRGNGQLGIIEVTNVVDPEALDKAVAAYNKAYQIDPRKGKDVAAALNSISDKFKSEAYTKYQLGDIKAASSLFEKAANAVEGEPVSRIDTSSVYYAGFTALVGNDRERAKALFEKCYKHGYYATDGELFSKLAEVDTTKTKAYLEEGFEKFPQSQSVLIGLINYYLKSGESTDRLFELLDKAKVNEPNNASLYYVEGNIHAQLGHVEKAVEAYAACSKIDPNYEYGYIGTGILYYNRALDIQTKAQSELDDNKYMALVADFEKELKSCIEPFEKAYVISKDNNVRVSVAEYLKNAYYRFRDQDAKYQEGYDKYAAVVASGKPE